MKWRTLTSNILSLIKRNIPSICTVLILSSPEPRKKGEPGDLYSLPSTVNWPSLLEAQELCFSLCHSGGHGCAGSWKGAAGSLEKDYRAHSRLLQGLW